MFGDVGKMMQKVKEMKSQMKDAQEALKQVEVEGFSKDKNITITLSGEMDIKKVSVMPDLLNKEAKAVENDIYAAFKDAINKAKKEASKELGGITNGMKIPGM